MERERLYKIFVRERILFGDFCAMHLCVDAHAPSRYADTRLQQFFPRLYIFPVALVQ